MSQKKNGQRAIQHGVSLSKYNKGTKRRPRDVVTLGNQPSAMYKSQTKETNKAQVHKKSRTSPVHDTHRVPM